MLQIKLISSSCKIAIRWIPRNIFRDSIGSGNVLVRVSPEPMLIHICDIALQGHDALMPAEEEANNVIYTLICTHIYTHIYAYSTWQRLLMGWHPFDTDDMPNNRSIVQRSPRYIAEPRFPCEFLGSWLQAYLWFTCKKYNYGTIVIHDPRDKENKLDNMHWFYSTRTHFNITTVFPYTGLSL